MWLIILLILLGVLFLVAELVLLPGVSLGALFALVCYGSAIYTAFADYGPFTGGIVVLIILALSFVATVLSLRLEDVAALLAETEDRVVEYAPSR